MKTCATWKRDCECYSPPDVSNADSASGIVVSPGGALHERLLEAIEKVILAPPPASEG